MTRLPAEDSLTFFFVFFFGFPSSYALSIITTITTTANRHHEDTDSHTPMHRERATVPSGKDVYLCVCGCFGIVGTWAGKQRRTRAGQGSARHLQAAVKGGGVGMDCTNGPTVFFPSSFPFFSFFCFFFPVTLLVALSALPCCSTTSPHAATTGPAAAAASD